MSGYNCWERNVKKHVYGRGEHSRIPLGGYRYCAIQEPVITTTAMKAGLDDVTHIMCINQLLQPCREMRMETQTNTTTEEIILSELQVA